jgi:TRAP-type C4-dicarboxylate transport system permease small subunit
MTHGYELEQDHRPLEIQVHGTLARPARLLAFINRAVILLSMIAIVVACCVLTLSVVMRYFLKMPTDWQDEASIFLLVGATFLTGAYVQAHRGHVGIEALAEILPAGVNRTRLLLVDVASFVFCAFFSWKSWTLLHEAVVDEQTTSSTWGPPLWIPYGLMSVGMTLLSLQLLLQVFVRVFGEEGEQ